jgi:tubulin epsilon
VMIGQCDSEVWKKNFEILSRPQGPFATFKYYPHASVDSYSSGTVRVFALLSNDRNQIAGRFWDKCLQEHAKSPTGTIPIFDTSFSSFFRNVDKRAGISDISPDSKICQLKARSVLIDMEPGVINQIKRSVIGEIFDDEQILTSDSGSGNNWAVGYQTYGCMYREEISEAIRREAEFCDALSSFFLIYSLGGGTGSGLGSYVGEMLADEYPDVFKFANVIFPSENDDVVTSPYNSYSPIH